MLDSLKKAQTAFKPASWVKYLDGLKIPWDLVSQLRPRELAGCGWEWGLRAALLVVCLSETTWQADLLQINEERWSISSGIRHSLNQCVIASYTVSILFRAENPLSGSLNKQQTCLWRWHSGDFKRCVFISSVSTCLWKFLTSELPPSSCQALAQSVWLVLFKTNCFLSILWTLLNFNPRNNLWGRMLIYLC